VKKGKAKLEVLLNTVLHLKDLAEEYQRLIQRQIHGERYTQALV